MKSETVTFKCDQPGCSWTTDKPDFRGKVARARHLFAAHGIRKNGAEVNGAKRSYTRRQTNQQEIVFNCCPQCGLNLRQLALEIATGRAVLAKRK